MKIDSFSTQSINSLLQNITPPQSRAVKPQEPQQPTAPTPPAGGNVENRQPPSKPSAPSEPTRPAANGSISVYA